MLVMALVVFPKFLAILYCLFYIAFEIKVWKVLLYLKAHLLFVHC